MKQYYLLLLLLYFSSSSLAQDKHLILFNQKDISGFSSPNEFLSQKSIDRRTAQGISINERDYPVTTAYIDSINSTGATVIATTKWLNGALVEADDLQVTAIMAFTFVKKSSALSTLYGGTKINEVLETTMFDYGPSSVQTDMLGVDQCHEMGFTGAGMSIAVLDAGFNGVDTTDPFDSLRSDGRIKATYDFVHQNENVYNDDDHGTAVLSTMAAYKKGELIGTAFAADYYLFVTEDVGSEYPLEEFNWLLAAERADSIGVDIINSSLGYVDFDNSVYDYTHDDLTGDKSIITQAADFAASTGILVVNSAGNDGNNSWGRIAMPADADSILVVGAVNMSEVVAGFSSKGPTADGRIKPDVMAMGVGAVVSNENGGIGGSNGTSFSAPIMAGFVACIWQAFPHLTNMELIEALRAAGDRANTPDNEYGYGIPTFERVSVIAAIGDDEHVVNDLIQLFPNPTEDGIVHLQFDPSLTGKNCQIQIFTSAGKLVNKEELTLRSLSHSIQMPPRKMQLFLIVVNYEQQKQVFRVVNRK